jgi:hypothetical protein
LRSVLVKANGIGKVPELLPQSARNCLYGKLAGYQMVSHAGGVSNLHESYDREHAVEGSSARKFGLVFAVVFALVGVWPALHHRPLRIWGLGISAVFLLLAIAVPNVLQPLNAAWMRFGLLLSKVTNPIVTALMFFVVFTPVGLILKLAGKDSLHLKADPAASSYWIVRHPPGPAPETLKDQF